MEGCWGRERHGAEAGAGGRVSGIVQRRGHASALGIDKRQLRGMSPEHVGQYVREILQQVKPIRHLAGLGSPGSRRFRVRLRAIPYNDLHLGMRQKPLRYGGSLPIRKHGEGPPPFEVQQEGAIGVTLPQREIVHAEDLRGNDCGPGSAADHP